MRERWGHGDFLYLNALDPSGKGCLLTVGFREREFAPDAKAAALFKRMASHLSAAYRCRRNLPSTNAGARTLDHYGARAEAILDDNGRFVHAEGPARAASAREKIRNAATAIESVRAERSRGWPAVEGWHPLTAARWTLVDNFEEGGRRYIVACENQIDAKGFGTLTHPERQIVDHAALGMTNKEIAYTLGVSHVTVRVLMARAAKRLGVNRRRDLLEHPSLQGLRPETGRSDT
jgi:DNA-binding CsgD family transcriptional regulator